MGNSIRADIALESAPMTILNFDAGRIFAALTLSVTALFLLSWQLPSRFAALARRAAVGLFAAVLGGALIYAGLWFLGARF